MSERGRSVRPGAISLAPVTERSTMVADRLHFVGLKPRLRTRRSAQHVEGNHMSTPWHVRITRQSGTARAGLALGTAFTALALVVSMTGPAQARPPAKPGNVGGLDITSMDLANDPEYTVDASWNPSSNTTSYLVKLVNA